MCFPCKNLKKTLMKITVKLILYNITLQFQIVQSKTVFLSRDGVLFRIFRLPNEIFSVSHYFNRTRFDWAFQISIACVIRVCAHEYTARYPEILLDLEYCAPNN